MWKIIKKSVDKVVLNKKKFSLWMKWEFKIEFASDSFGPYNYKFEREDCYFNDWLEDRGTKIFPLRNKSFDNTEIFMETDDIVIAVWERGSLTWWDGKSFIDVINIKTEKKYRVFTEEVNLIYNTKNEIVLNLKEGNTFKTIILDINTMEKKEEKKEKLLAFFKCVYVESENQWYRLDFTETNPDEKDEEKRYQNGYYSIKKIDWNKAPKSFNRESFSVELLWWGRIDIWDESF